MERKFGSVDLGEAITSSDCRQAAEIECFKFRDILPFRCLHQPLHIKLSVGGLVCCVVTGLNQTNVKCTMFYCSRPQSNEC